MLTSPNGTVFDLYDFCQSEVAFYQIDAEEIIICPLFFNYPAVPSTSQCLTVNKYQEKFYQDGSQMYEFQLWILLHEIVHFYKGGLWPEVYDVNACLRLNAGKSVVNAQNYLYYAASKSLPLTHNLLARDSTITFLDIRSTCTDFPKPRRRASRQFGPGFELLEVDNNGTLEVTTAANQRTDENRTVAGASSSTNFNATSNTSYASSLSPQK